MATLVATLRGLKSDPFDDASPPLPVFEGDLTSADESTLTAGVPYAVVLGLPETVRGRTLSGNPDLRVTLDVVLEQRGQAGQRPHKKTLTALRNQILRLAPTAEHLAYQIPFSKRLEYISGTHPEAKYRDNTTLTATLRFQGVWRADFD